MNNRPVDLVRNIAGYGAQAYIVSRLQRELASPRATEEWVRFVFETRVAIGPRPLRLHFSLRPDQNPGEITRLLELVARESPRRVLEVGSAGGGTLFLFARAAAPHARLVGLDLPPHAGGGLPGWRAAVYERGFASPGQRIQLIRGDSHSEATQARVRNVLGYEPVDFLFIDADHSYEGVRRDFELYSPLVRPGGLIGMHDILQDSFHRTGVRTGTDSGEVFRFWQELRERHPNRLGAQEFVDDPTQDGLGIGVLRA